MTDGDDDLRFGDVDHERGTDDGERGRSGGGGSPNLSQAVASVIESDDIAPILVGVAIAGYILLAQPLSSSISGISMNWLAAAIVLLGGLSAASST